MVSNTAQKMKFSVKDFFNRCDQIRIFLRILSHLLKKSLTKSFIFCAVGLIVLILSLQQLFLGAYIIWNVHVFFYLW